MVALNAPTRLALLSLCLSSALSDSSLPFARPHTQFPPPHNTPLLLRLRGGSGQEVPAKGAAEAKPTGWGLQDLMSGPHVPTQLNGGIWQVVTSKNADGDDVTIFRHNGTCVFIEVDHEYSDGGIQFGTPASSVIQVITHESVCEESELGFQINDETRRWENFTGLDDIDTRKGLGDWTCVYMSEVGTLKLTNTFFNSVLYLHKEGNFVFLTNPIANKSFGSVWGRSFELDRKAGVSLSDFLHQGSLNSDPKR